MGISRELVRKCPAEGRLVLGTEAGNSLFLKWLAWRAEWRQDVGMEVGTPGTSKT